MRAQEASRILEENRRAHQAYLEAAEAAKALDARRKDRDRLDRQRAEGEVHLRGLQEQRKNLEEQLAQIARDRKEAEELRPLVQRQAFLEKERSRLQHLLGEQEGLKRTLPSVEKELRELKRKQELLLGEIASVGELVEVASDLKTWEEAEGKLGTEIAQLKAHTDRNRQVLAQVQEGLCPLLRQKCLNLKEGQGLDDHFRSELKEEVARLNQLLQSQQENRDGLRDAREADRKVSGLEPLRRQYQELCSTLEGKERALAQKRDELKSLPAALKEFQAVLEELNILKDPRGRMVGLARSISQEPEKTRTFSQVCEAESTTSERLAGLRDQLQGYAGLEENWAKQNAYLEKNAQGHRLYLSQQALAAVLPEREAENQEIQKQMQLATDRLTQLSQLADQLAACVSEEKRKRLQKLAQEARDRMIAHGQALKDARAKLEEVEAQIGRLERLNKPLREGLREKKELKRCRDFVEFARDILKQAGPVVARAYITRISQAANRLYQEITGNPLSDLRWEEDYEVLLEEGGRIRPFNNLSGGEQMVAALALRLALLKEVSDVNVAFFDEPTNNMDEERRRNLAEQIRLIRGFRQLFVISHDDTFERVTDNVVRLENRSKAVSGSEFPVSGSETWNPKPGARNHPI